MQMIEVLGIPGSPYTRKMLALFRYRRINYQVLWGSHIEPPAGYPSPKVKMLPTFYFHEACGIKVAVDSTPIIRQLEALYSERSVIPDDPLLLFLDQLIEDFADEWLTKAVFHYRWSHSEDAFHVGPLLGFWQDPRIDLAEAMPFIQSFSQRQRSRLHIIGSNDNTAPIIEASFERLVFILDRIISRNEFSLGNRPGSCDFALYGQLTQLAQVDPTPARLLEQKSPRLRAWIDRAEDLSGLNDGQWLNRASITEHLGELLREIGLVYVPFLVANANAMANGQRDFFAVIDGQPWKQPVFPYQVKCLESLRSTIQSLSKEDRRSLREVLDGTGCEVLCSC